MNEPLQARHLGPLPVGSLSQKLKYPSPSLTPRAGSQTARELDVGGRTPRSITP